MIRVRVTGDAAVRNGLRIAGRRLARLDKPTREATQAIARAAAALAPKRTRRLSASNRPRNSGGTGTVTNSVRYAPFVEHGTTYMHAQPFLRPALYATDVTDFYTDHAEDSVRHL